MGCDVPQVNSNILSEVYRLLVDKMNVIGPASDGGFYLLGLNRVEQGIFDGIDWGKSRVLSRVRRNCKRLGITLTDTAELRDIDDWEDLCWLAGQDPSYQGLVN